MNAGRIGMLVGALAAAGIIAIGWLGIASPLFKQADDADVQRVDVESNNQQLEITLAGMKKLDDQKEQLLADLEGLRDSVPTVAELEDYLDWLAGAAAIAAVSVPNYALGSPQLISVADGAVGEFNNALKESLYLIPVTLDIGGNPEQMTAFVKMLQTDGRLQIINKVGLNFGTSLSGKVEGFVFVIHDPASGPIHSDGTSGELTPSEGEETEPTPGATPTPPAEVP